MPPSAAEAFQTLRALKTVALADGALDESECHMLRSIQRVLRTDHPIEEIPTVRPAELAGAITQQQGRRQLVHALIAMSLVDAESARDEEVLLEHFARELGVSEGEVDEFRRSVGDELETLSCDVLRRVWADERRRGNWSEEALAKILDGLAGGHEDGQLAARYRELEHHAPGSLGRAYWDYLDRNGFSLPGEKGAAGSSMVNVVPSPRRLRTRKAPR